jgi:REP element-mobilizing transposase RayT
MSTHAHLPRLAPAFYRGHAMVHWTLTMERRATGWLDALFHARFREILLHTACRYGVACPVYCLMPDHLHLVWLGERLDTDQRLAMRFFRQHLHRWLHPVSFQKQAYDHVLRETERDRNAFRAVQFYILENPVRAGLVETAAAWAYSGCLLAGFPDVHPLDDRFEQVFWARYEDQARASLISTTATS